MRGTHVYLAGPMRGLPNFNFPAFHAAAADLRDRGYEVWSPAEHDRDTGFVPTTGEGLRSLREYMRDDLPALLGSDKVVVLPGWEASEGARLEVHVAETCGIPVLAYAGREPLREIRQAVRKFESGATRDTDEGKPDYEGFLSPLVLARYARYMNKNRVQSNGSVRDSDNWQKGIPTVAYMKSLWRHFMEVWTLHRAWTNGDLEEALCAVMFNAMGYLHELLAKAHDRAAA